jgi:beta-glucosidase
VAEAGNYEARVGASSQDIKQVQPFRLEKELITGHTTKSLAPQVEINELKKP